ncbi:hypothetical protein P3T76_004018 [Phytophthora citrophthora]|uniref:Uncharacterized protein n=1 Tax=Phytophthora citrophthora TaxID=4793 RepID=A0AAD9LPW9_9STRA|nr:hypothetical protein P3T76_004018 [Phytophthora citrophthora]
MSSPSATYDFIKWWATTGQGDNYGFENRDLPYLDIHGADMTEELLDLNNQEVFFASSIVYVKMMLVKGIKEGIVAYELAAKVPQPAVVEDSIRGFLTPERLAKGLGGVKTTPYEAHESVAPSIQTDPFPERALLGRHAGPDVDHSNADTAVPAYYKGRGQNVDRAECDVVAGSQGRHQIRRQSA